MNYIARFEQYMTSTNHYSNYFPIFRVFLCLVILKDLIFKWEYNEVLYATRSFVPPDESFLSSYLMMDTHWMRENMNFLIWAFMMLVILYFFGIGRHFVALLVFLGLEIKQRLCYLTLNGGDNLLKFLLLYMIVADSYQYFVVGNNRKKPMEPKRYSNLLSNLAGLSICFHLCLAYFVSAFNKIHAEVWFNGSAIYYIFSLDRFQGTFLNSIIAKNGVLSTLITYFTLVFEMFFPVLIWIKNARWPLIAMGICLHLSIFVFMMIHDFQFIFISIYGFFIYNKEWENAIRHIAIYWSNLTKRFTFKTV